VQQLVGRLTALDHGASEALKVIAYFDTLIDAHATAEMILRGAAVLSGTAAGFASAGRTVRVDVDGVRDPDPPAGTDWPSHTVPGGGIAWLERTGDPSVNDAIVLERLAIAIGIMLERSVPFGQLRRAIEDVFDDTADPSVRRTAVQRLGLAATGSYRVVAHPATDPVRTGDHQAVVATAVGGVRALVRRAGAEVGELRAGVGPAGGPEQLDASFSAALVALRLTTERTPVVHADDLGPLIALAPAVDRLAVTPPDVTTLGSLVADQPRVLALLDALVATDSLRAAAGDLGLHHSTVQSRVADLSGVLGFDLRTPAGRHRLALGLALHRLATTRFCGRRPPLAAPARTPTRRSADRVAVCR